MSAFQPFGATNYADTCKWCGRPLRHKYETVWRYLEAQKCKRCGSTDLKQHSTNRTTKFDRHYICNACDAYGTGPREVVERVQKSAKPGGYHDGHFCGLGCGYQFAVALANSGRKLAAIRTQEE